MSISASAQALPVLNDAQIAVIRNASDEPIALMGELIELYANEAVPRLEIFADSFAQGDLATAAKAVHSLAGSAANLGAQRLATLAREAENSLKAGDSVPPGFAETLRQEHKAFVQAFRAAIPGA